MSSKDQSDANFNAHQHWEASETDSAGSMARHLESLLDQVMISTAHRDELLQKLQALVRDDPNPQLDSKEQLSGLIYVTLVQEFQLLEPVSRVWSRTAENVASTLWNHLESRVRLEKLWQKLKADTT